MLVIGLVSIAGTTIARAGEPDADRSKATAGTNAVDFTRDIRPILADKCFQCHGPTRAAEGQAEAGQPRGPPAPAASGSPAIVPGKLDESELYQPDHCRRSRGADAAGQEQEVAVGRRGRPAQDVDRAGGRVPATLGVRPAGPPALPSVKNPGWCRNPIDVFILARLEDEGLQAVARGRQGHADPPAEPRPDRPAADDRGGRRLSRRQARRTPTSKLVDRLLDSPHYGERWARHLARRRPLCRLRRLREGQVAPGLRSTATGSSTPSTATCPTTSSSSSRSPATCCPDATQDQIVATGFLRNSMINEEGGVDPEQFRMEAMFDRMDAIGKGILGLTIQCAQCHNHKYDPLTQEEYYRMFAFLNNTHEANIAVYTPDEQMKRAEIFREIREIEDDLQHRHPDWRERMAAWEKQVARRSAASGPSSGRSRGRIDRRREVPADGRRLVPGAGLRPDQAHVEMTVKTGPDADHRLPAGAAQRPEPAAGRPGPVDQGDGGPDRVRGRGRAGRCTRQDGTCQVRRGPPPTSIRPRRRWSRSSTTRAARSRVTGPIDFAIDGKDETAWGIDVGPGRRNQPRKAVFTPRSRSSFPSGHDPDVQPDAEPRRLEQRRQPEPQPRPVPAVGHQRARSRGRPAARDGARGPGDPPRASGSAAQDAAVFSYWRTTVPEWKDANDRIDSLWKQHPEGSTQLVLAERAGSRATPACSSAATSSSRRTPVEPGVPRS